MWIWHRGTSAVRARVLADQVPLKKFVETLGSRDVARVPGTAVFLTRADSETPPVLVWHVRKNRSLHQSVLILKLIVTSSPRTKPSERIQVARVADKFSRVEARYGFMERPNVLAILDDCMTKAVEINRDDVTFYIGHETIIPRGSRRDPALAGSHLCSDGSQLCSHHRRPKIAPRPSSGNRSRG